MTNALQRLDEERVRYVVTEHMRAVERLIAAGPNPLRAIMDTLRAKGSLTDASKLNPHDIAEILEGHASGPGASEAGAFWANIGAAHALAGDHVRIRAILEVVGLMGDEEAVARGTETLERGI